MRISAFITDAATIRDILLRVGGTTVPARIALSLGLPPSDLPDAATGDFDPHAKRHPRTGSINPSLCSPNIDGRLLPMPGRCVPAAAGARCELRDACESPASAASPSPSATPDLPGFPSVQPDPGRVTLPPTSRPGGVGATGHLRSINSIRLQGG